MLPGSTRCFVRTQRASCWPGSAASVARAINTQPCKGSRACSSISRAARHPPGGGMVAKVGFVDHAELDRDGGGLGRIGLPSESGVCPLQEFERLPDLTQPPQRLCQAGQDLSTPLRFTCAQRMLERGARLLPSSPFQGLLACLNARRGRRLGKVGCIHGLGLCRHLLGLRARQPG